MQSAHSAGAKQCEQELSMNPSRLSEIGNRLLSLGNPLSWHKLADLSQWMELDRRSRVLDLGAGKGEVLMRLVQTYDCGGLALERRSELCEEMAETLTKRELASIQVVCEDARRWLMSCPPAEFDAILCLGASGAMGGYTACLAQLDYWLKPGGYLLIGEGYWKREPAAEYLDLTGIPEAEMATHADNAQFAIQLGWEYLMSYTASEEEWDAFEGRYHLAVRNHLRDHPDDPDAADLDRAIQRWHRAYLAYGRETLGFGAYLLRKLP